MLLLLWQYTWGKMPELSTQYLSSPSRQALYRVGSRRRTSQGFIMWDGLVAENSMMESWAELTGCAVQVGHNHDLQKFISSLIPTQTRLVKGFVSPSATYYSFRRHVLFIVTLRATRLLAGRFTRQVLFVATFQVTCSLHCNMTSYQATCLSLCKCGLFFILAKSFFRSSIKIHGLPTSLIISSHYTHHRQR